MGAMLVVKDKAFLSLGNKTHFYVNYSKRKTNMAASSRGYKPKTRGNPVTDCRPIQ